MNRRHLVRIVLLIASAGTLAGCAVKSDPVSDEHAYWQRLGMSLKDSTQPREQALAAQLLGFALMVEKDDAQAIQKNPADSEIEAVIRGLLAKVNNSNDVVALSLATQAQFDRKDQSTSAIAQSWQAIEPDNLAPLLFSEASIQGLLANARDVTRYNSHGYEHVRLMASAFKRLPMISGQSAATSPTRFANDDERATVNAFGMRNAFSIPSFMSLTNACKGDALVSAPMRRQDCLHVAKVLAMHSDDLISRSIGIAMLERAASTPEDIVLATTLRKNWEWQQHQYYAVLTQHMDEQQQVREMLRLLKTPGVNNEIQLRETALSEKGVALTPPEDWQPPKRS